MSEAEAEVPQGGGGGGGTALTFMSLRCVIVTLRGLKIRSRQLWRPLTPPQPPPCVCVCERERERGGERE